MIGFYTLVVGEVAYDGAPERLTKGLARHPVPAWPRECDDTKQPFRRTGQSPREHSQIGVEFTFQLWAQTAGHDR